MLYLSITGHCY